MGLKTKNYTIPELGLTLPEAYAIIRNMNIYGENGNVEFAIQASRESAINLEPLKTVHLAFKVDRNESPYVTAYNLAKSDLTEKRGPHTITRRMPFYGWEDDLAYET